MNRETQAAARNLARLPAGGWPETQQARHRLREAIIRWDDGAECFSLPGGGVGTWSRAELEWIRWAEVSK